jgi:hypothetical protein
MTSELRSGSTLFDSQLEHCSRQLFNFEASEDRFLPYPFQFTEHNRPECPLHCTWCLKRNNSDHLGEDNITKGLKIILKLTLGKLNFEM